MERYLYAKICKLHKIARIKLRMRVNCIYLLAKFFLFTQRGSALKGYLQNTVSL